MASPQTTSTTLPVVPERWPVGVSERARQEVLAFGAKHSNDEADRSAWWRGFVEATLVHALHVPARERLRLIEDALAGMAMVDACRRAEILAGRW